MTATYRLVLTAARAFVQGYGRLTVHGIDHVPRDGPVLIVANHDSPLDAFIIAVATRKRRELRFLTKRSLWKYRPLGLILDKLRQIPIERGRRDASGLGAAVAALKAGDCVCVFPEGTISRGRRLRIRAGSQRILASVPNAAVVGCAITGATSLKRLRFRARVGIVFFPTHRSLTADAKEPTVSSIAKTMEIVRHIAPPSL